MNVTTLDRAAQGGQTLILYVRHTTLHLGAAGRLNLGNLGSPKLHSPVQIVLVIRIRNRYSSS